MIGGEDLAKKKGKQKKSKFMPEYIDHESD